MHGCVNRSRIIVQAVHIDLIGYLSLCDAVLITVLYKCQMAIGLIYIIEKFVDVLYTLFPVLTCTSDYLKLWKYVPEVTSLFLLLKFTGFRLLSKPGVKPAHFLDCISVLTVHEYF